MSPKAKDPGDAPWDASQVVAYRLQTARELRGKTQAWAADRISRFTDSNWTAATLSLAESGSRSTKRLRSFTAKELVAFARTYDLPVFYFFIPPADVDAGPSLPGAPDAGWGHFIRLVFGHQDNLREVRQEPLEIGRVVAGHWSSGFDALVVRLPSKEKARRGTVFVCKAFL